METDFSNVRTQPARPQEAMNFTTALEAANDRLDGVDRIQRLHAQSFAHMGEDWKASVPKISNMPGVDVSLVNSMC